LVKKVRQRQFFGGSLALGLELKLIKPQCADFWNRVKQVPKRKAVVFNSWPIRLCHASASTPLESAIKRLGVFHIGVVWVMRAARLRACFKNVSKALTFLNYIERI